MSDMTRSASCMRPCCASQRGLSGRPSRIHQMTTAAIELVASFRSAGTYHESSRLIAIIAQFSTRSPPGYRQEREDKCDELWLGELNGNRRRRLDSWSYCPWEEVW